MPALENKIMALLEKQNIVAQEAFKDGLKDIFTAHKKAGYSDDLALILIMEAGFNYGLICGKRLERTKRRGRKQEE